MKISANFDASPPRIKVQFEWEDEWLNCNFTNPGDVVSKEDMDALLNAIFWRHYREGERREWVDDVSGVVDSVYAFEVVIHVFCRPGPMYRVVPPRRHEFSDAVQEMRSAMEETLHRDRMVFRHVLTTPRKDRDGDILRLYGDQVAPIRPEPKSPKRPKGRRKLRFEDDDER